jgi:hypothetical protein
MDWAFHESQIGFDIRAEREECERLFKHRARVLQDRLGRCGGGERTKEVPVAEWERVYRKEASSLTASRPHPSMPSPLTPLMSHTSAPTP